MADLSEIQAAQGVKLAGAVPSTGVETNWAVVDTNGSLRANDLLSGQGQYKATSVGMIAVEALGAATILTGRKILTVTPTTGKVYWGYDSSVTISSGTPIAANTTYTWNITEAVHIYLIATVATDCRITEGS